MLEAAVRLLKLTLTLFIALQMYGCSELSGDALGAGASESLGFPDGFYCIPGENNAGIANCSE